MITYVQSISKNQVVAIFRPKLVIIDSLLKNFETRSILQTFKIFSVLIKVFIESSINVGH